MSAIQFILVVIWAFCLLGMLIASGVGAGIQAAGLSKTESVPFFLVFLFLGVIAALSGLPIFLWIF